MEKETNSDLTLTDAIMHNVETEAEDKMDEDDLKNCFERKLCPKCLQEMEWSNYSQGNYENGWQCNGVGCQRGTSGEGYPKKSRWLCRSCEEDRCSDCGYWLRDVGDQRGNAEMCWRIGCGKTED